MALTPATIRRDLKCGRGAISPGEKCTKSLSSKAASPRSISAKKKSKEARKRLLATAAIVGVAGLGAVALSNYRRRPNAQTSLPDANMRRAYANYRNRRAYVESQGQTYTTAEDYVRTVERRQREVMRENDDFMRGYRIAPETQPRPSTTEYAPAAGSVEARVHAAWTAKPKSTTRKRYANPNPDVSAAWGRYDPPAQQGPYQGDPDLRGVWARGFNP